MSSAVPRLDSDSTYQWFWNGTAIAGATSATYVLTGASANNDGAYSCLVTNAAGSVMSVPSQVNVVLSGTPGRFADISSRAPVGVGADAMIAGFVVGGPPAAGNEDLLIRVAGPALAPLGVAGVLADPSVELDGNAGVYDSNQGWDGNPLISAASSTVGAFPWPNSGSLDAALFESLAPGAYTAVVHGASGDSGVALAEVYDAGPAGAGGGLAPHLINVSTRAKVGSGGNILIAGFVIGGATSKTVLIRASGPALTAFGVTGVLADPSLALYQSNGDGSSTLVRSNTGWAGDAEIASIAAAVGAFSWGPDATPDSAVLVTLSPGAYTVEVSGTSGDAGIALVEVYDVP